MSCIAAPVGRLKGADVIGARLPGGNAGTLRGAFDLARWPTTAATRAWTSSVRQSSASGSIAVKSRCAIHSFRLKRRMWLST